MAKRTIILTQLRLNNSTKHLVGWLDSAICYRCTFQSSLPLHASTYGISLTCKVGLSVHSGFILTGAQGWSLRNSVMKNTRADHKKRSSVSLPTCYLLPFCQDLLVSHSNAQGPIFNTQGKHSRFIIMWTCQK